MADNVLSECANKDLVGIAYKRNRIDILPMALTVRSMSFFNVFQKKTQKTPRSEIEKAKQIRKEYYESKK